MRDVVVHCAGAAPKGRGKPTLVLDVRLRGRGRRSLTLSLAEITRHQMTNLPDRLWDLLEIACYVHAADRMSPRDTPQMHQHGENWRRNLTFVIAVRDPDFWNSVDVANVLRGTLSFLSGDRYSFEFQQLDREVHRQEFLALRGEGSQISFQPQEVILFSGGLDSLAGAVDALLVRQVPAVLVSYQSSNFVQSVQAKVAEALRQRAGRSRLLHVGLGLERAGEMVEATQRTRSFLFGCVGLLVARIFQRGEVAFYENGIVSTNLPIASHVLGTRATRTTHPRVLADYSRLFARVTGADVRVTNPFFWDTKKDVVRRIADAGCSDLIAPSFSCGATRKATLSSGQHCGVCTQCLDRRFGILAAGCGTHEPASNYAVELMRGERRPGLEAVTAESYLLAAHHWARSTQEHFLGSHGEVFRAIPHLGLRPGEAAARLHQLHRRHGQAVARVVGQEQASVDPIADRLALPDHSLLSMLQGPLAQDVELRDPAQDEGTPTQQADQRQIPELPRPLVFSLEPDVPRVLFAGGVALKGAHARIVVALLDAFQQGLRAGRGETGAPFVLTKVLAERLDLSRTTLTQYVRGLRLTLRDQFKAAFGTAPELDDVIESRTWKGYRLNPHLVLTVGTQPSEAPETEATSMHQGSAARRDREHSPLSTHRSHLSSRP